jgi:cobalamin synthase
MKNNPMQTTAIKETAAAIILVLLLLLIVNPYHLWMPDMVHMMAVTALLVVSGFFASLILREQAHDEREGTHRMQAGRSSFLVGSFLLIVAISYQSLMHALDSWLPIILVAMVLTKIGSRLYTDRFE